MPKGSSERRRWPDGITPYAYGGRFWEYVARTAGDSLVGRFAERTAGQLIPFRVGRPLNGAGAPQSIFKTWSAAVATASHNGFLPPRSGQSSLIAGELRTEPVPRVAPDGSSIAYLFDDGRNARQLRVVNARTGEELRSRRVNAQVSYDWLGDTLIVAQLEYADRWTVRSDLWRWSPSGNWDRMSDTARLLDSASGNAMTFNGVSVTRGGMAGIVLGSGLESVSLDSGSANDSLQPLAFLAGPVTLRGGCGNDTLSGGGGDRLNTYTGPSIVLASRLARSVTPPERACRGRCSTAGRRRTWRSARKAQPGG